METSDIIQLEIMLSTAGALFFTVRNFGKQLQLNFFAEYTKRYQEIILNFLESINERDFDFDKLSEEEKKEHYVTCECTSTYAVKNTIIGSLNILMIRLGKNGKVASSMRFQRRHLEKVGKESQWIQFTTKNFILS